MSTAAACPSAGSPGEASAAPAPVCRLCGAALQAIFLDLGALPLSGRFLSADEVREPEPAYPLRVFVCARCFFVQADHQVSPQQLFGEYAYFSSYSTTWLEHARAYAAAIGDRLRLTPDSLVVEIASNDGYLLRHFLQRGIPVLGIEPAANVAQQAREIGVPTIVEFFDGDTARRLVQAGRRADLVVGNNVLAHVPDPAGFVHAMQMLLKPGGLITMEFPYLVRLIEENQFDTIYHEHFSYFSFAVVDRIVAGCGLTIVDVEELPTHGGSLRIHARHRAAADPGERVHALRQREAAFGLSRIDTYTRFVARVEQTKRRLVDFLVGARRVGKRVAAYGAPAKGNTLLNYCGIGPDLVEWTVDRNPYKQGKFLPGSHIPIFGPEQIALRKPEYLLILPWNLKDEIMHECACIRAWGGRFVTPIPDVTVWD